MANILLVDDDPSAGLRLADALTSAGHRVPGAQSVVEALQVLSRDTIDLIISRFSIPELPAPEFVALLRREGYDVPLLMVTGEGSDDETAASIEAGVTGFVTSPVRSRELQLAVQHALDHARLQRANDSLRRELMELRGDRAIVSASPAIRRILHVIATVAPSRAPVLLEGEAGTGKELFARAIHDRSDRREAVFITINCGAVPEGLQESALFGHERGAVPGATRRVEGVFEQANGGTLLIDEVSALRPPIQARLLHALEAMEVQRVGGTTPLRVDVRVIAGTTAPLARGVASGAFRQDLGGLLGAILIEIPALRDRGEDIPMLAHRFARMAAHEVGKEVRDIAPDALDILQSYTWPGNVRELRHAVERAVILTQEPTLQAPLFDHLRSTGNRSLAEQVLQRATPTALTALNLGQHAPPRGIVLTTLNVDEAEGALIRRALEVTGGNRTRTAELLGISVRTLRNKLNGPQRAGARVE